MTDNKLKENLEIYERIYALHVELLENKILAKFSVWATQPSETSQPDMVGEVRWDGTIFLRNARLHFSGLEFN